MTGKTRGIGVTGEAASATPQTPEVSAELAGEPTGVELPPFWSIAKRGKWVAALFGFLAVAALFAVLANWQLARSVDTSAQSGPDTEQPVAFQSVASPQVPMVPEAFGRTVQTGVLSTVPGDTEILSGRVNHAEPGWWVVVHTTDQSGASLAVAVGWAPNAEQAQAAAADLDRATLLLDAPIGRYLPSESPQQSDFRRGVRSALSVGELINLWSVPPAGVYGGYLILDAPLAGLEPIDAPPPNRAVEFSLLNLFYALEWVLFAGFALFLWWRLVQDERERIAADAADAVADSKLFRNART